MRTRSLAAAWILGLGLLVAAADARATSSANAKLTFAEKRRPVVSRRVNPQKGPWQLYGERPYGFVHDHLRPDVWAFKEQTLRLLDGSTVLTRIEAIQRQDVVAKHRRSVQFRDRAAMDSDWKTVKPTGYRWVIQGKKVGDQIHFLSPAERTQVANLLHAGFHSITGAEDGRWVRAGTFDVEWQTPKGDSLVHVGMQ
jgi:hypothetical protein